VLRAPGIDHVFFNRVIGFGCDPEPERTLEAIHRSYRRLGVNRYFLHVSPRADSGARAAVAGRLTRYHRSWVKLGRSAGPVAAARSALCVRRAEPRDREAFAEVLRQGFGWPSAADPLWHAMLERPRWYCFFAQQGKRIAAAATLFVDGRVGYLASAATLPEYRQQGAQSILLEQRVRAAAALGCRMIYSETGEALAGQANSSERNMRRAGFKPLYVRENFAAAGSTWPAPRLAR
jgi:ribosomal protein S18 acetylase RimI-like enzyme